MSPEKCPNCGTFLTTIESPYEYEVNMNIKYCKKCTYEKRVQNKPRNKKSNRNSSKIYKPNVVWATRWPPSKKPISKWNKLTELYIEEQNDRMNRIKTCEINQNLKIMFHYMNNIKSAKTTNEKLALLTSRKVMHDMLIMIDQMYKNRVFEKIDGLTALDLLEIHMQIYKIFNDQIIQNENKIEKKPGQILKEKIEKTNIVQHCPDCGGFLKEESREEYNAPDMGKIIYIVCNNCKFERPIRCD